MRSLLAIFLSLCLCLNAAHAAESGVHEAVEHGPDLLVAIVFEAHDHHHDHAADHGPDSEDMAQAHADHCHAHPPLFTLIPGTAFDFVVDSRCQPVRAERHALVSVSPPRLERPPRSSRA